MVTTRLISAAMTLHTKCEQIHPHGVSDHLSTWQRSSSLALAVAIPAPALLAYQCECQDRAEDVECRIGNVDIGRSVDTDWYFHRDFDSKIPSNHHRQ